MVSSGGCPHVTPSVSSEYVGEARLVGWIGEFGLGSDVFLFKNYKHKNVIKFIVLLLLDVIK